MVGPKPRAKAEGLNGIRKKYAGVLNELHYIGDGSYIRTQMDMEAILFLNRLKLLKPVNQIKLTIYSSVSQPSPAQPSRAVSKALTTRRTGFCSGHQHQRNYRKPIVPGPHYGHVLFPHPTCYRWLSKQ